MSSSRSSRSPKDPELEYARAQQAAKAKKAKSAALALQLQNETEPSSASRMRPISDVCNRIKHDVRCQQYDLMDWFTVVYLDRLKGEQTVKFSIFFTDPDCEDVPMHRVLRVKLYDFVLWDRERKIDRVFGSSSGHKDEQQTKMNLEQVLTRIDTIRNSYEARVAAGEEAERRARLLEERKLNGIHHNIQLQRRELNQKNQQETDEEDQLEEMASNVELEESTSSDSMSSLYETDEEKVMALVAESASAAAAAPVNNTSFSPSFPSSPSIGDSTFATKTTTVTINSTTTTTATVTSATIDTVASSTQSSVVVTSSPLVTPVRSSATFSSPYSTIVPLLSSSDCRPNYFICLRLTSHSLLSSLASFQSELISHHPNYAPCSVPIATAHITLALMQLSDDREVETAKKIFQSMEAEIKRLCRIPSDHQSGCGSFSSSSSSSFSPLSVSISGVSTFSSRVLFASIVPSLSTSLLQSVVALFQYRLVIAGIRVVRATEKNDVNLFVPHCTLFKTSTKENKRQNRRKSKMKWTDRRQDQDQEGKLASESKSEDRSSVAFERVNSFDSSSYSKYSTHDFGVQLVDAFHLCAMAGPKQSDGFYPIEASVRSL